MIASLVRIDPLRLELFRYIANGIVATVVHYSFLRLQVQLFEIRPVGLANALAACVGTAVSFIGSRYFVFRKLNEPWRRQLLRFVSLYAAIAVLHGILLYGWTDMLGLNYTFGFGLAVIVQVISTFFGNKYLVFK